MKIPARIVCIPAFIFCFFLVSCGRIAVPDHVRQTLEHAESNKAELLKVLEHYSNDSLKFAAASFLITNLDGRYYFKGELLDKYMEYPKLVLRDLNHGEYIMNSINKMHGPFSEYLLDVKFDLLEVKAEDIISNIDASFDVWKNQPWSKNYNFTDFCHYVLPFRIKDEVPSYERSAIYKRYKHILDTVPRSELTAVKACAIINDVLIKEQWILSQRASFLPHYNASTLMDYRVGTCRDMADLGIYVMRSAGIPVTSDFVPQWPYRAIGHRWNVVIDEKGKAIPFLGAEDSPGTPHKPRTKKGKVYRSTSQVNLSSLASVANTEESIPLFFKDPCIKDVTDEYAKTFTCEIFFDRNFNSSFGYLSVFNNFNWMPIAWSKVDSLKATFEKVEGDIVYLPSYYQEGVYAAGHPFLLDSVGQIRYLVPDTTKKIKQISCSRIYPIVPEGQLADQARGGKFQGANKPDFSDAEELFLFKVRSLPYWNDLQIKTTRKFRYIRYLSSPRFNCHIAELQFYSGGKKLKGDIIGSSGKIDEWKNAFDSDELTSYHSNSVSSWIGFDLGATSQIDRIRFFPAIDTKDEWFIIPGRLYTLRYWCEGKWKTIERKLADSNTITFDNVPSNALFLLTTGFREERIFTYENNKQVWW